MSKRHASKALSAMLDSRVQITRSLSHNHHNLFLSASSMLVACQLHDSELDCVVSILAIPMMMLVADINTAVYSDNAFSRGNGEYKRDYE